MTEYRQCVRCVIDTTDPNITFDEHGVCNHCHRFDSSIIHKVWKRDEKGKLMLDKLWDTIKREGRNKEYDCILGLSGGIDSSYLLYISKLAGLKVLAVHVDAGWNSETAVHNIQKLCSQLEVDLVTDVVNWNEMLKLQRAFLRSRVINQDIPQDHAFFASLYKYAVKNRIKYVLSGANVSSESILPYSWRGYQAMDSVHVKDVFRKNSSEQLKNFPLMHYLEYIVYYPYVKRLKVVTPLNYIEYDKFKAVAEMESRFGYQNPGEKHYESRFTRFYQRFYLYEKFGIDERKAHYASLILAGQMSRDEALLRLQQAPYKNEAERDQDINFVCNKLNFTREEFDKILMQPNGRHEDYKSTQSWLLKILPVLIKIKRSILPFSKK